MAGRESRRAEIEGRGTIVKLIGAITALGALALGWFITWRITSGVESWFAASGAGNVLGWSLVAALALAVFAIPAGAWGLAIRMWVVKMRRDEYLGSTPHALLPQAAAQIAAAEQPRLLATQTKELCDATTRRLD
jgi:hypothetical protein